MNEKVKIAAAVFWLSVTPASSESICKGIATGNIVNPDDCGTFITCENWTAVTHTCPKGLYFNPNPRPLGRCDYPENTTCKCDYPENTPCKKPP